MKDFFLDLKDSETILTIVIALLLGLIIGVFFHTNYSLGIRTFIHDCYLKINPDAQKDSKTLIIDNATKDLPLLPQNSIFEETKNRDNFLFRYIKKIFTPKTKKQTIYNINIE